MNRPLLLSAALLAALAATSPSHGQAATNAALTITLESAGNIERNVVIYQCADGSALNVQYLNAAPNFLAIVPIEGVNHVFATTLSGSGARYVAGPYEWWSHQGEATLRDLTQAEDAAPLAQCSELSGTP